MKNKSEVRNKMFHIMLATCVQFSFLESTQLLYECITFFCYDNVLIATNRRSFIYESKM